LFVNQNNLPCPNNDLHIVQLLELEKTASKISAFLQCRFIRSHVSFKKRNTLNKQYMVDHPDLVNRNIYTPVFISPKRFTCKTRGPIFKKKRYRQFKRFQWPERRRWPRPQTTDYPRTILFGTSKWTRFRISRLVLKEPRNVHGF
jgi:hypothetical protein